MPSPKSGYFTKAGKRVPGTTTVIGGNIGWGTTPLCIWANQKGLEGISYRDAMQPLGSIGTAAHAMAEADITGQDVDLGTDDPALLEKAKVAFESYLSWKSMTKMTLIGAEIALVDDAMGYGGTLDAVGVINGKPALIDFKTSNHLRDSHIIQLAAYANLWEQAHPDMRLTGGYHILKFSKDSASFAHHSYAHGSLTAAWESFKHALALHGLKKAVGSLT